MQDTGSQHSCVRAEGLQNSQKSCVRAEGLQEYRLWSRVCPSAMTQSCSQLLRVHLTTTDFLLKQEQEHIPFQPWCTSCVKGQAQAEPHKRFERVTEDSERPSVQCDYIVLKCVAASDGVKLKSKNVKSLEYGTYTVVETKGATDTFAVTWRVKVSNCPGLSDTSLQGDSEPSLIMCAESAKSKRQDRTVIRSSPRRSHQSREAVETI